MTPTSPRRSRCNEEKCRPRWADGAAGVGSVAVPSIRSSRAMRASPMSRSLRAASRSRQRARSCRSGCGVWDGNRDHAISPAVTAARVSGTSRPVNTRSPESISNSTAPNAQMSLRRSPSRPRACSGLMYAAVPTAAPGESVGRLNESLARAPPLETGCTIFARPKSSSFTVPSGRRLTLDGLRSRWMMPRSCAASSAPAICRA